VASGLAWLHGKKLLHYRLKPSNILFTRDWRVKIADYGLDLPKKYLDAAVAQATLFQTKHVHYSAPEVVDDKTPLQGSDMWAYGMVLYALVTWKNPYSDAKDYGEVAAKIKGNTLPELPKNTPQSLREMIQKCWAQKPEDRGDFLSLTAEESGESVFKKIFNDAIHESDKEAALIWKSVQAAAPDEGGKKGDSFPWNVFAPVFFEKMGVKDPSHAQIKCIQALMQLGYNAQDTAPVTHEHYHHFVQIFTPIRPSKDFISSVVELCKQDYFYGIAPRASTEAVLNKAVIDKKKQKSIFTSYFYNRSGSILSLLYPKTQRSKDGTRSHTLPH